jgi:hypothetical protein
VLIWVASYPRSGSNLTLMTLGKVFGFRKRGLTSRPDETRQKFGVPPTEDLVSALSELDDTVFLKTHGLPGAGDEAAVMYLVRDGRDALVSHAHYVRGRDKPSFRDLDFEAALERIIRRGHALMERPGQVPPNVTWSDHVRTWTTRSAPTALVRFESLIEDPGAEVGRALGDLGVGVPESQGRIPSFEDLQNQRDTVMFRRGKAGAWRDEMPPRLQELFWELHGTQMEALGYSRE